MIAALVLIAAALGPGRFSLSARGVGTGSVVRVVGDGTGLRVTGVPV